MSAAALSPWGAQFGGDSTSDVGSSSAFPQWLHTPAGTREMTPPNPPGPQPRPFPTQPRPKRPQVLRLKGSKDLPAQMLFLREPPGTHGLRHCWAGEAT